jgi:Lrp/AsnC family leucine-responsive transcriptional regulator
MVFFKLFFKFQNLDKETEAAAFDWMVKNDFVYWIASAKGRWDVNLTIFAHDINHFEEIMAPFYTKFGPHIQEQEFNTTLEIGINSKDWLLGKKACKTTRFGKPIKDRKLDAADVEILKLLANNARMSAMELSRKTGLTQRQVLYRIKELERERIIMGYTTSLNLEVIGMQFFKSIIHFNYMNEKLKNKIFEFYNQEAEVGFFVFCVGSWPTEVELIVKDNTEYYEVMDKMRASFPEMRGYETIIFPKEYKFDWMPLCYKAGQ